MASVFLKSIRIFPISLIATTMLITGCDITPSEISELSEPKKWEKVIADIEHTYSIEDPLRRCIEHPSPPHLQWPKALVEALCRDEFTLVRQSDAIKPMIDKRDWEGLRAHYDGYLTRHYAKQDPERAIYRAIPTYSWRDEADMAGYTKRWLDAQPQDPYANTLRSRYLIWRAWKVRGDGFASTVSPEQDRESTKLAREASILLTRAIKQEPRLMPAYETLIEAYMLSGEPELMRRTLQIAARHSPDNYYVRATGASYLRLIWRGTPKELDALADDAKDHLEDNPRLSLLFANTKSQLAYIRSNGERHGRALTAARDALEHGPHFSSLSQAAFDSDKVGYEIEAIVYMSQLIRFEHEPKDALVGRGWRWERVGFYPRALRDYREALRIAPDDTSLKKRISEIEQRMKTASTQR